MRRLRRVARLVILGRPHGLRARLRRFLGFVQRERDPNPAASPAEAGPPSAPAGVPDGFHPLVRAAELEPGDVMEVAVADRVFAVANVEGTFYAIDNTCPHAGGPLGDGTLSGAELTCPYHGWSFDVRTGACFLDAATSVASYSVEVVDGTVCVRI